MFTLSKKTKIKFAIILLAAFISLWLLGKIVKWGFVLAILALVGYFLFKDKK